MASKHMTVFTTLLLLVFVILLAAGQANAVSLPPLDDSALEEAQEGAITYMGSIGSEASKTSGTSLVIHTTALAEAGDDIIIAYATDPNANIPPIVVNDTAGNTYSEVGLAVNTGQLRTYIFAAYDINPLPAGSDITITASAAVTARVAVVSVFRGLADEEPLDQTSTGTGDSTTPSSGATATTTEANELLVGAIGTEGPDPGGIAIP